MRILLIHQAFARIDEPGGTRHHEFARILAERGHRVTVLASPVSYLTGSPAGPDRASRVEVDDLGVRIIRCASYGGWHRSFRQRIFSFVTFSISALWEGLRIERPDLVWGTSPPLFQAGSAWLLAAIKRSPFLLEIRDLWPRFAVEVGVLRSSLLIRLSRWLERFLYGKADLLIVNSPGFVEHVSLRGARHVEVVPNGVDVDMFADATAGADLRARTGVREGDFLIVYAGAHGLSNDLGVVLQAAEVLRDQAHIQIVFLGDGKEKPALQDRAQALRLENVHFLPPLAKDHMASALAESNAGLAILKPLEGYRTTLPNKVFDYMAAGLPVLLAIDGVIRSVVEDAGAGVFVPPGDADHLAEAIREMAANPQRAVEMGERGRRYVRAHYSRADLAGELEAHMRTLIPGQA